MKNRSYFLLLFLVALVGCISSPQKQAPLTAASVRAAALTAHQELMVQINGDIKKGVKMAVWDIFYTENHFMATEITETLREATLGLRQTRGIRLVETDEYTLKALEKELNIGWCSRKYAEY